VNHTELRVPRFTRLTAVAQYPEILRDEWYLLKEANDMSERMTLLRFILTEHFAFLGLIKRRDRCVRFRGCVYFVERTGELRVLGEIYRHGDYSRDERFLPRSGATVLDIGANVGLFTIYHAAAGARVLAVEPSESPHRRLVAAVTANGFADRVAVVRAAIGPGRGRSRIVAVGGSTLGRAVPIDPDFPSQDDEVDVLPLDEVMSAHDLREIDLLKIDVEGAEVEVLRGARATLARTRRVILEYHSEELLAETRQRLSAAGFAEVRHYDIFPGVGMLYMARPEDADRGDDERGPDPLGSTAR
jgi:FkbM family methyltransferase